MKLYLIVGMSSTQYLVETDDAAPPPKAGERFVSQNWGRLLMQPTPKGMAFGCQIMQGKLELIVAECIDGSEFSDLWLQNRAQKAGLVVPQMRAPRDIGKA